MKIGRDTIKGDPRIREGGISAKSTLEVARHHTIVKDTDLIVKSTQPGQDDLSQGAQVKFSGYITGPGLLAGLRQSLRREPQRNGCPEHRATAAAHNHVHRDVLSLQDLHNPNDGRAFQAARADHNRQTWTLSQKMLSV